MLELSNQAEDAIRDLLASDDVPDGAGLRISAEESADADSGTGLAVSISDEVLPEDQVIEGEEIEVRLEPAAAEMLEDKQLDATVSGGEIRFSLTAQGG